MAQFTDKVDFPTILKALDDSIPSTIESAIPIWFKWYSWTGQQRTVTHFTENTKGFQCAVDDYDRSDQRLSSTFGNPLAACYAGSRSKYVRGLCVFPPLSASQNVNQETTCPAVCLADYNNYCWPSQEGDTTAIQDCPADLIGNATWTCGIDGQWITPYPDLRYRIHLDTDIDGQDEFA